MKSYLGWPIVFSPYLKVPEAHVTLKYFGSAPISSHVLRKRLEGKLTKLTIDWRTSWKPEVFFKTRVMVLSGLDGALLQTKAAVDDIRKDDYPDWRPHISLPKEPWGMLAETFIPPWQVIVAVGPLTHFVDGEPEAQFL